MASQEDGSIFEGTDAEVTRQLRSILQVITADRDELKRVVSTLQDSFRHLQEEIRQAAAENQTLQKMNSALEVRLQRLEKKYNRKD